MGSNITKEIFDGQPFQGYEIHMGLTTHLPSNSPDSEFLEVDESRGTGPQTGLLSLTSGNVAGSYVHGLFDNAAFSRDLVDVLRAKKGLPAGGNTPSYRAFKEEQYNRLADIVRNHVDIKGVISIIKNKEH